MLGGFGFPRVTGNQSAQHGMPETGVRPDVQAGAPAGVRHQLANREVLGGIRQRSAARLAAGAALGRHDGQIVRVLVGVVAQEQGDVVHRRLPVLAAPGLVAAVVQRPGRALQPTGVDRVVLHQQRGRGLQGVHRLHQFVAAGLEKVLAGLGEADRVEQQRIQGLRAVGDRRADRASGIEDRHDVGCRRGVGVVEVLERAPVLADGVAALVESLQHLIEVGGGLAHARALPAHPVGHGGQHRVQLGGVDHVEEVDHILEDGVDLGGDVGRLQNRAGGQPLRAGFGRIHEVDELGAERGCGSDLSADIGWDVADLVGLDLQTQAGVALAAADSADPTDLDPAQLHLRAGFHHQPGPVRRSG